MNTPTTNYIEIDGEGKYIEDTDCREMAAQNANAIQTINSKIPASASASNKLLVSGEKRTYDTLSVGGLVTVTKLGNINFINITDCRQGTFNLADVGLPNSPGNIVVPLVYNKTFQGEFQVFETQAKITITGPYQVAYGQAIYLD